MCDPFRMVHLCQPLIHTKQDLFEDLSLQRKTTNNVEAAQQNIRNILEDNNLLAEDLKGIKIDFNFSKLL